MSDEEATEPTEGAKAEEATEAEPEVVEKYQVTMTRDVTAGDAPAAPVTFDTEEEAQAYGESQLRAGTATAYFVSTAHVLAEGEVEPASE
jgi:hypothetical protein